MGRNKKFIKDQELQVAEDYKSGLSSIKLAEKYGRNTSIIFDIFKRNRVVLRTPSEAMYGKHCSEEAKQILREKNSGEKNPMFGKHPSEETIQKMSKANSTPERIQITLKNSFGKKCYYDDEFFPSLQERNCYIYLIMEGYLVIHNFLGRFDFLVNGRAVVEFHQFNYKGNLDSRGLTEEEYYNQRRKLLDDKGYKDLKLVVIKDLKEIENLKKEI